MRVALGLYHLCARAILPRGFREEFGDELEATVAARVSGARGPVGRWTALAAELIDLVRTAVREWKSVWSGLRGAAQEPMRRKASVSVAWNDLRTSARSLVRRPGLALGVTLTIGLGIGATTTIYSVVDGVILRPLPYEDPDRLVMIGGLAGGGGAVDSETGLQELTQMTSEVYKRYRERARAFDEIAAITGTRLVVSDDDGLEEQIISAQVSPEIFEMLGVSPVLGRTFLPEEYAVSLERVVMLSYDYWQSRYGGDPSVLGQPLESAPSSDQPRSIIVGILPDGFQPPETLFPTGESPRVYGPLPLADPGPGRIVIFSVYAMGRLSPGATVEGARAEAEQIFQEIESEVANLPVGPGGSRRGIGANGLHEQTVGSTGRTLWIFLGAAGLLLALTAMNAASLVLARALDRTQELGVRVALGAGRARVVLLLLVESLLLAAVGGLLGVALAYGGVATFLQFAPPTIPRLHTVAVDGRVLAAAAVMTLGTAIVAGLFPALRLTSRAPWERLQGGGRSVSEPASGMRAALVGGQLALAVVLLSGAGLLFGSFMRLRGMDPGFEPDGLIVAAPSARGPMRITMGQNPRDIQIERAWAPVLAALEGVPGIEVPAAANTLPFQAPSWAPRVLLDDDEPEVVREGIAGYVVTPGYLETMETRVVEGRSFQESDGPDSEPVVIVNEAFVRTQLGGREPVGMLLRRASEEPALRPGAQPASREITMRIVGVVEDVVQARAEDGARPAIYIPHRQADFPQLAILWAVVRAPLEPEALTPDVRRALTAAGAFAQNVQSMEGRMAESRATPRFQTMLIGAFALVAMLLAAVGLHGSLAHAVRRRQRELGVRMALGADRSSVLRMVLAQGMRVSLVGLALGMVATLAMSRVLAAFLYDMQPYDPITLMAVAGVLILVSAAACLAPARRATAIDPVRVLSAE